jgi:hypothetical protein
VGNLPCSALLLKFQLSNFKSCHGLLWTSAFLYTVFLADIELLIYEVFLSPADLHNYTKKFHVK